MKCAQADKRRRTRHAKMIANYPTAKGRQSRGSHRPPILAVKAGDIMVEVSGGNAMPAAVFDKNFLRQSDVA